MLHIPCTNLHTPRTPLLRRGNACVRSLLRIVREAHSGVAQRSEAPSRRRLRPDNFPHDGPAKEARSKGPWLYLEKSRKCEDALGDSHEAANQGNAWATKL